MGLGSPLWVGVVAKMGRLSGGGCGSKLVYPSCLQEKAFIETTIVEVFNAHIIEKKGDTRAYTVEVARRVIDKYPAKAGEFSNLQRVRDIKRSMNKGLFKTYEAPAVQAIAPIVVGVPAEQSGGDRSGGITLPLPTAIWDDISKFIQGVEAQMERTANNIVTGLKPTSTLTKPDILNILKRTHLWRNKHGSHASRLTNFCAYLHLCYNK